MSLFKISLFLFFMYTFSKAIKINIIARFLNQTKPSYNSIITIKNNNGNILKYKKI